MPSDFTVQFYGCRGSFPVSGAEHQRYGGSTPCVVVRAGSRTIVIDGGSGLVRHGQDVIKESFAAGEAIESFIFISHLHLDHVIGLPFFGPMYIPSATINIYGPRMGSYPSFESAISTLIHPPFFPVPLYEMQSSKQFHDITEAHESQRAIKESLLFLELAQSSAHAGHFALDPETMDLSISTWLRERFGVPTDTLPLAQVAELVHESRREETMAAIAHAIAAKSEFSFETLAIDADGKPVAVVVRGTAVFREGNENGQLAGFYGIIQDITEQKEAAEALLHARDDELERDILALLGVLEARQLDLEDARLSEKGVLDKIPELG